MKKRNFKGKNILITGASGNLGTALCEAFGAEGASIMALDLKIEGLEALSTSLKLKGIRHEVVVCDICDAAALSNTVSALQTSMGPIDVLVNNAGITHIQKLLDTENPEQVLRRVMEVNFFAATALARRCLPNLLAQKGLIINISSVAGFAPLVGRTAYAASKHALEGFFESLRNELYEQGVQCLTVCPAFIGADAARVAAAAQDANSIYQQKKTLGKVLDPKMVAAKIIQAAKSNKNRVVIGPTAIQSYWVRRLFPSLYEKIMRKRVN